MTETNDQNSYVAELPSNVPASKTTRQTTTIDTFGNEFPGQKTDQISNPKGPNPAEAASPTETNEIPLQKVDGTTNLQSPNPDTPPLHFVKLDIDKPGDEQIMEELQYQWAGESGTIIWDKDTEGGDQAKANYLNGLGRQKVHPSVIVSPNIPAATQPEWLYNGKTGGNH